jgi:predicted TIM-barrel fold metal-dependent hydrolase
MRNGFKIFDADRHVLEPLSLWTEYLPSKFREWAPSLQDVRPANESLAARLERLGAQALLPTLPVPAVKGTSLYRGMPEAAYIELGVQAMLRAGELNASASAAGQLANMDRLGIDVGVLLPTYASYLVHDDDIAAPLSRAYAKAYNRWMYDLRRASPERLLAASIISCHDPEQMAFDLDEALAQDPVAVVLRPNPIQGRTLADPRYRPFWQACQFHDLPVLLHEGTHAKLTTAGVDRYASRFGQHACSHPLEAMLALLSLIEGGVFSESPDLRVAVLEAGCGWLPYWLWRLDEIEYRKLVNEVSERVKKPPSTYFREHCWIAFEPGEALLDSVIAHIGPDRFLLGTDFPHLDHDSDPIKLLLETGNLSPEAVRRVLWENAASLFKIALRVEIS